MASIKIPVIVITVTLALLNCLSTAWERHDINHPAAVSAPASLPDYAPLSVIATSGKSEQSLSTRERKIVASNNNCVPSGGASSGSQGQNGGYGGYGGPALPGGWSGGMGGGSTGSGGGLGGWGPMTGGGVKNGAAKSASSIAGFAVFSAMLLVTGVMYI